MFKVLWKNTAKIIHQDIIEHKIVYPLFSGQTKMKIDRLVVGGWLWWWLVYRSIIVLTTMC